MKEKNPIDELFKRRLTEDKPAFNEAHWEAMEQLLGQKKRKFGFWFWLVPLFFLLGVSVFGLNEWFEHKEGEARIIDPLSEVQEASEGSLDKSTPSFNASDSSSTLLTSVSNKIKRGEIEKLQSEGADNQQGICDFETDGQAVKAGAFDASEETNKNQGVSVKSGRASKTYNGSSQYSGKKNVSELQPKVKEGDASGDIIANVQSGLPGFKLAEERGNKAFNASVFMPFLNPKMFEIKRPASLKGSLVSIDKFKPRHWKLSAFSNFGKYKIKESLASSSDLSISSEYAEPVPLLSQTVGVRLDYIKRGWVFSSGFSYTTINEEVDFGVLDSALVDFEYFEYQVIDSINDIIVEVIDSVFVEEEWQLDTIYVTVQDTSYIWLTDSLGIYSANDALLEERPYKQQASYVELPLLIGRQLPVGARGTFTLRTGPVIGFRTIVQGYYFASPNSDSPVMLSNRRDVSKSVVLNWQLEFEYAYQFSPRMSMGVLVGDRRSLTSYFKNGGAKQGYKGQFIGLSFGYLL
ncbi:MAG: hypothetical protein ACJAU0_002513 [Flavobacteriales bacterium]